MSKPIKYTFYISHYTQAKNNLHKELEFFFFEINQLIFSDLKVLKKLINHQVNKLNEKHSRCKAIELTYTGYGKNITIHGTNVVAVILECKEADDE